MKATAKSITIDWRPKMQEIHRHSSHARALASKNPRQVVIVKSTPTTPRTVGVEISSNQRTVTNYA